MGVGDNMYHTLKDLYITQGSNLSIRSGGCLSNSFRSRVGVRQGDPLSPALFKVYINDIVKYVDNDSAPMLAGDKVQCLLFADDIVLLSTSQEGLQNSVRGLEKFVLDWNINVNTSKTKVMVFNKKGRFIQTNITYGNNPLQCVNTYKYLGLLFSVDGKFATAHNDLVERGLKSMFKLTSMFKMMQPTFTTAIHLFDRIVKPVLMYGADICGYKVTRNIYSTMTNHVFEKCHLKFCRFFMGINKFTPKLGIYGDAGRYPLLISSSVHFAKYWSRVKELDDNSILSSAVKVNIKENLEWFRNIKNLFDLLRMDPSTSRSSGYLNKCIITKLTAVFRDGWSANLASDARKSEGGNKLRTYRKFKQVFKTEPYLDDCCNESRYNLARLRLSSHSLHIETGRHVPRAKRLPPEQRTCNYCTLKACEDEYHFVTTCHLYEELRRNLVTNLRQFSPNYRNLNITCPSDFNKLMSSEEAYVTRALGKFVKDCFLLRKNATPSNF